MLLEIATLACSLLLPNVWLQEPAPSPHLEARALANVVYVQAGTSTGTAFLMRHGSGRYLVTARHLVDAHLEDPSVPLTFHVGGRRGRPIRTVRLLRESQRADIAVFEYEEDPRLAYFAGDAGLVPHDDLRLATPVFLVGYPASLQQTYGSTQLRVVGGWVAGLRKHVPGSTVEYVDIDMAGSEHGHSGGPILLLPDRVVAVAVQRRSGSVHDTIAATYAVPVKYVTALIDGDPVPEDLTALNETLRDTSLVAGLALHGKDDHDIWVQRIHWGTGERVWGDGGLYVASSPAAESSYAFVPSDGGSLLAIHTAAYPDGADVDVLVQKISRYGELLFEQGLRSRGVALSARPERAPAVVSDGEDGAIVVYEIHLEGGDVDVHAQRVSPEGTARWAETGVPVSSSRYVERRPVIVSDGAGGAIVVLEIVLEDGDVDVVAQHVRADGTLAWHEGKKPAVVASAKATERRPRVVPDGRGGAIVFYEMEVEAGRRALMAQHVSRHGELLWNEGERGTLVVEFPLADGDGAIAAVPDGLGGAFVAGAVRTDAARPEDVDVALQRLSGDGRHLWGTPPEGDGVPPAVLAASSAWPERRPVLHADGQGGVVVAFEAGSAEGDLDVLAQRVDGDGRLRWNEGQRSAHAAFTFLSEHTPRIVDRSGDRILFLFEVEREDGRSLVACQALSIETGAALYGGGKLPMAVVDPGSLEIHHRLRPRGDQD